MAESDSASQLVDGRKALNDPSQLVSLGPLSCSFIIHTLLNLLSTPDIEVGGMGGSLSLIRQISLSVGRLGCSVNIHTLLNLLSPPDMEVSANSVDGRNALE